MRLPRRLKVEIEIPSNSGRPKNLFNAVFLAFSAEKGACWHNLGGPPKRDARSLMLPSVDLCELLSDPGARHASSLRSIHAAWLLLNKKAYIGNGSDIDDFKLPHGIM